MGTSVDTQLHTRDVKRIPTDARNIKIKIRNFLVFKPAQLITIYVKTPRQRTFNGLVAFFVRYITLASAPLASRGSIFEVTWNNRKID